MDLSCPFSQIALSQVPPDLQDSDTLCRRFHDICDRMTSDRRSPSLHQSEHNGNQGRPDEHAQEAEGDEAAKDAEDGQRHRHLDAKADQPRFDEIVDHADEYAPDYHEHAPYLLLLGEQPPSCSTQISTSNGPPIWLIASSKATKPSIAAPRTPETA